MSIPACILMLEVRSHRWPILRKLLVLGALWLAAFFPARLFAQTRTDARDYEIAGYPARTLALSTYLRHESSTGQASASFQYAVFGASYVMRFGNLGFAPFNAFLPVVDATVYAPSGTPGLSLASHVMGIGDLLYLPAVGYDFQHGPMSHTWTAFALYVTMPTGSYRASRLANTGENRWAFRPQAMAGHRFLKILTFEAVTGVGFHTANRDVQLPDFGKQAAEQRPSAGLDLHLAADLSEKLYIAASYYFTALGRRYANLEIDGERVDQTLTTKQQLHTLRFTWAVRIMPEFLLLLQYNQDVASTNDANKYRFFGARLSYALF